MRSDRNKWNPHRAIPYFFLGIDSRSHLKAGIPDPAIFVVRLVQIDVQIDPFSLGRNFKFLIVTYIFKIRTDKDFGNIPVPKLVRFFIRMRAWFQIQLLVRTDKKEIELTLRPSR